jgi:hypothetical protein
MIKSNYGNYVIQKALKVCNINNKFILINNILQNLYKLGDKKLMIKWKHIIDESVEECMKFNQMVYNNNYINRVNLFEGEQYLVEAKK